MANIHCNEKNCVHNAYDYKCNAGSVDINFDADPEYDDHQCRMFEDITTGSEYNKLFYKRFTDKNNKIYVKRPARGKRMEGQGFVLFTEEDCRHDLTFLVTEEITGICFHYDKLNDDDFVKRLEECIKTLEPVTSLDSEDPNCKQFKIT